MILSNLGPRWSHPEGQLSTFTPTVTVTEPQLGKRTNGVPAAAGGKHLRVTAARGNCVCGGGPTTLVFQIWNRSVTFFSTSEPPICTFGCCKFLAGLTITTSVGPQGEKRRNRMRSCEFIYAQKQKRKIHFSSERRGDREMWRQSNLMTPSAKDLPDRLQYRTEN